MPGIMALLHRRFIRAPLLVLCWLACWPLLCRQATADEQQPRRQRLTVLHTSDLHGHVLPYDDIRNRPARGSLAQVATLVSRIREAAGHPVLVLDSGDAIQGSPLEQLAHVEWGLPSPTITAMNRIGYAAMAIGNHELNFGLEVLHRAEAQAAFPLLSANMVHETDGTPAFPPYRVVTAGALRVGILGLVTPGIPAWEQPEHYRGLRFPPPHQVAPQWLQKLREQEHCDLVVVLAHTGFERDPVTGAPLDPEAESFAWRLAQLPGIDLLLVGHSHRNLPPQLVAGTIVAQPWSKGRILTRIELELTRGEQGWQLHSWQGESLSTAGVEPDQEIVSELDAVHRRVEGALAETVATVAGPLSIQGCSLADCSALELLHAVQLEATGADLSLASILTTRTPDLVAGPVPWRWLYGFYVYPNILVKLRVTGAQVKEILEHAARYYNGISCDNDRGCTLHTDPTIPIYDVDSMAGVTYRIDPFRPVGDRVRELRLHGLALDPVASLTLAANSYRAAGGGDVPHLADAEVLWRSTEEMTKLIAAFLVRHQPWQPRVDGNWSVAPTLSLEQAPDGGW